MKFQLCAIMLRNLWKPQKACSYQLGIKVVGVPIVTERETSQQTAHLCLKVVAALGVEDVTFSDNDTAYRGCHPALLPTDHYL